MLRGLVRACLALTGAATLAASCLALSQNPLAAPIALRSAAELRLLLPRAEAAALPDAAVPARLADAVAAEDRDRAALYAAIAEERAIALPQDLAAAAEALLAPPGPVERAGSCGRCALDLATCQSLEQLALCALPVEMTPLGDANALRREATHWAAGEEVDRLTAALAATGLAASAAILVSGGSSGLVKAGATGLRIARSTGRLTARLGTELGDLARGVVVWERLPAAFRAAAPTEAVDLVRAARLGDAASEMGRLARNAGPAQALDLLRHAESGEHLARLARISDAAGPATWRRVEIIGPARALRMASRLTDLALLTLGLLAALASQVLGLLLWLARRFVASPRRLRHDPARR